MHQLESEPSIYQYFYSGILAMARSVSLFGAYILGNCWRLLEFTDQNIATDRCSEPGAGGGRPPRHGRLSSPVTGRLSKCELSIVGDDLSLGAVNVMKFEPP